jgi:hypothetical protein
MSKVKVDAGMMKEHKAAVNDMLYPHRASTWHGAVIQDEPEKHFPWWPIALAVACCALAVWMWLRTK